MPSLVKIFVECGRDLPVMDRNTVSAESSTDAYVEVRLNDVVQRTATCRKSLNPVWKEEFRFEVLDDSVLQDAPVELKCMDQDLYLSEPIGVVYIDLNPLIMRTTTSFTRGVSHGTDRDLVIDGWFPLFDTERGLRGSIKVVVKLQFLENDNPLRDSSAGVQFFSASTLSSQCFFIHEIIGFVEDLVVEDDPESSWQDYFRKANKSSNDSRLKVLYNLSAEVRRELGKKVIEAGGNAVLAYSVQFDIEGASGIVARANGTACRLLKVGDDSSLVKIDKAKLQNTSTRRVAEWASSNSNAGVSGDFNNSSTGGVSASGLSLGWLARGSRKSARSPMIATALIEQAEDGPQLQLQGRISSMIMLQRETAEILSPGLARRISNETLTANGDAFIFLESVDETTAKAVHLIPFGVSREKSASHVGREGLIIPMSGVVQGTAAGDIISVDNNNVFEAEVQLLSLKSFESNVRFKLGGLVLSRSVKFLGKLEATISDQETREGWWDELREEIKNHAKVLCCRYIIGYSETCTIYGDVCVLSAVGTAASVKGLLFQSTYLSAGQTETGLGSSPAGSNANSAMAARQRTARQKSVSSTSPSGPGMYPGQQQRLFAKEREDSDDELYSPVDLIIEGNNQPSGFAERESERERDSISESSHSSRRNLPSTSQHKLSLINPNPNPVPSTTATVRPRKMRRPCAFAHVPYNHNTAPFSFMRLVPCLTCRRKWVPETILSTIEPPTSILVKGKGQLLEARVCRQRKAGGSGENEAVKISDVLPFVEYDIQRQIILKLKVLGMNAAFGYTCRMQVGSDMVIATAICTAVYLESLPPPQPLQISTRLKSIHTADSRAGAESIQNMRLMKLQKEVEELTQFYKSLLESPVQVTFSSSYSSKSASGEIGKAKQIASPPRKATESSNGEQVKEPSRFITAASIATLGNPEEEGARPRSSTVSSSSTSSSGSSSSSSSSSSTTGSSSEDSNDQSGLESPAYEGSEDEADEEVDANNEDKAKTRDRSKGRIKSRDRSRSKESNNDGEDDSDEDERGDDDEVGSLVNIKSQRPVKLPRIQQRQLPFSKRVSEPPRKQRRSIFRDDRAPFILELDDETDADITTVLADWIPPIGIDMINLSFLPVSGCVGAAVDNFGKSLVVVIRGKLSPAEHSHGGSAASAMLHSSAARTAAKAMKQTLGRPVQSDRLLNGAESGLTPMLNRLFHKAYLRLCYSAQSMIPCQILGITHSINILEEGVVEVFVSAMVQPVGRLSRAINAPPLLEDTVKRCSSNSNAPDPNQENSFQLERDRVSPANTNTREDASRSQSFEAVLRPPVAGDHDSFVGDAEGKRKHRNESISSNESTAPHDRGNHDLSVDVPCPQGALNTTAEQSGNVSSVRRIASSSPDREAEGDAPQEPSTFFSPIAQGSNRRRSPSCSKAAAVPPDRVRSASYGSMVVSESMVMLSSLPCIPGARIIKYLGPVQLHFIKDSWNIRGEENQASFFYTFVSEANAVARAHVASLGGNALLLQRMIPQESGGRLSRNQAYNMFSVTGDAVFLEFSGNAGDGLGYPALGSETEQLHHAFHSGHGQKLSGDD